MIAVWLQASRLFSLTASITPVLLGTAIAWKHGYFSPGRFGLVLVGSIAIHLGTNLINDYYDFVNGIDVAGSTGSSKVIQEGLLTPSEVWWGGIVNFAIGASAGMVLVRACGWPIFVIGLISIAAGYFYTASPIALGYTALGEPTVFIFMGPVMVLGAYYAEALHFAWQPFIASLPIAFLVAAILHANNIRDIDTDVVKHKMTLANLLGRRAANRAAWPAVRGRVWELGAGGDAGSPALAGAGDAVDRRSGTVESADRVERNRTGRIGSSSAGLGQAAPESAEFYCSWQFSSVAK